MAKGSLRRMGPVRRKETSPHKPVLRSAMGMIQSHSSRNCAITTIWRGCGLRPAFLWD